MLNQETGQKGKTNNSTVSGYVQESYNNNNNAEKATRLRGYTQ